ncbi:hypothetical protein NSK_002333 [Nannochloropsis salina CCMP1776]|uniref:Bacterial surface antigen (D15) domain-containing protein n=1 Tax=Nannochloropsis salina CCMP1776 TaxID=1027361 RepID=A0A4D9DDK4_9STRA|nr:hypothetical protein NSK_002333 [Nannochloropsis salina CCMP1776]|eukprot:TFJ86679.1 hypothetical protein NSK_002333 [Nannochloropsis salina CCMP1776]
MRSTRVKCRPAWLVWSVMGFLLLVVVLLPPYSQAAFGLTSRRPPPLAPPPLPSTPPTSTGVPLARNDPSSQKWDAENDDASPPQPSLLEEILRRLRGDFSHPLTESTRLVVHYDCRDYRSGLRGLGLRHVWRDVGLSLLSDEDTATDAALLRSQEPGLGGQGWRTWFFPWEIRGGVSVKRIQGVSVPQFWRMRRLDRLLWASLHLTSLPTSTSLGAAFDGASQHMRFEASHATRLRLPFLDEDSPWNFLHGYPLRFTLSPLLAARHIDLSTAIPRRPAFRPSIDLLSLGLGCEWVEPVLGRREGGRGGGREGEEGLGERGAAAIRVGISAKSFGAGGHPARVVAGLAPVGWERAVHRHLVHANL